MRIPQQSLLAGVRNLYQILQKYSKGLTLVLHGKLEREGE